MGRGVFIHQWYRKFKYEIFCFGEVMNALGEGWNIRGKKPYKTCKNNRKFGGKRLPCC